MENDHGTNFIIECISQEHWLHKDSKPRGKLEKVILGKSNYLYTKEGFFRKQKTLTYFCIFKQTP